MTLFVLPGGRAAWAQPADAGRPVLAAAQREAARLAEDAGPGSQAAGGGRSAWFARHPVLTGTVVGAGAGLALAQVEAIGGRHHDPGVALVGAGAGAWGGLIASAVQSARAGRPVRRGTKVGIIAGAVAAGVLPVLACYGAGGCGGSS
jgi:hypothetical protein